MIVQACCAMVRHAVWLASWENGPSTRPACAMFLTTSQKQNARSGSPYGTGVTAHANLLFFWVLAPRAAAPPSSPWTSLREPGRLPCSLNR
jgi:hypothetical protein